MDSTHRLLQSSDPHGPRPTLMKTLISIAALAVMTLATPTQARDYVVELLIFAHNAIGDADDERWPQTTAAAKPKALDLFGGDAAPRRAKGFSRSDRHDAALEHIRRRLMNADNYRLLAHRSWRQPGLSAADAVPIRIAAGPVIDNPAQHQRLAEQSSSTAPSASRQAPDPGGARRELEGAITVTLGRYLHVRTDLVYWRVMPETFGPDAATAAANPATADSTPDPIAVNAPTPAAEPAPSPRLIGFRMQQHRRMRSQELHYLDHPMLGVIVIVNRA